MNLEPAQVIDYDVIRPTKVLVDLDRLTGNFNAIKRHCPDTAIMPILKANAYGHGLIPVARHLEKLGADYLGVAVLEEGLLLRKEGISLPILILGGILGNQITYFIQNDLTLTASSIDKLHQIEAAAIKLGRTARVHLKIDTGMERIGVHHYNARTFIETAYNCSHLEVEGIFTHFANADSNNLDHAREQVKRFNQVLDLFDKLNLPQPRYRHMANSGAILQLPEARLDMVRPGILLYGVYPSPEVRRSVAVEPVLTWKSRVVYFKVVKAGNPVGYGSEWQADHNVRTVTVPVGYGDGYFRSMTGKATVLINRQPFNVIGRIAMDQIVVNLEQGIAHNDDEVILLGQQGDQGISCEDLALWSGTIPYEVLTNINTRVPRLYIEKYAHPASTPLY